MCNMEVINHYDLLIEEDNDPFRDPPVLQEYMSQWDGEQFIEAMELTNSKRVLEIGIGTGRLAVKVAPFCMTLTGIDISPKTIERAKELLKTTTTQEHLFLHAGNVAVAMGGMAVHFGENKELWMAIGLLHDYDYEQHPDEHLDHTAEPLKAAGVTDEEIRAILSHGYTLRNDVEPLTNMEKSMIWYFKWKWFFLTEILFIHHQHQSMR